MSPRRATSSPPHPPTTRRRLLAPVLAALGVVLTDLTWPGRRVRVLARGIRQRGGLTWRGRLLLGLTLIPLTLICASSAVAEDLKGGGKPSGAMASFDAVGSNGIRLSQYELNIYDGSGRFNAVVAVAPGGGPVDAIVTIIASVGGTLAASDGPDPVKMFYAAILGIQWDIYRLLVGVSIWLYQLATSYEWMDWIIGPARIVANAFQEVLDQIGVRSVALTIAGLVCVVWMARGRWAAGVSQLFLSFVIAALATGALAHPVDQFAGPDGALDKTQQFGLQLTAVISSGAADNCARADATTSELQQCTQGQVVDAFVRAPHQMVNYGANIDVEGTCRAVYDEVLKQGLWGDVPAPRSRMGQCKEEYGKYAYATGPGQIATMAIIALGGFFLLAFMVALTLVVLIASFTVVWESVKLVINLIKAIIPGATRGSLYQGLAQIGAALAVTVAAQVLLSIYVLVLKEIFVGAAAEGMDANKTFLIIDLVVLSATVILVKYRAAARRSAHQFAERLASLGASSPTQLPAGGNGLQQAMRIARTAGSLVTASSVAKDDDGPAAAPYPRSGGGEVTEQDGASKATAAQRLQGRLEQSRAGRVAVRTTKVATVTAGLALKSTVGAPVYAPRAFHAAKQAAAARKAALNLKLKRAQAFADEYGQNMHALARFTGVDRLGRAAAPGGRADTDAPVATDGDTPDTSGTRPQGGMNTPGSSSSAPAPTSPPAGRPSPSSTAPPALRRPNPDERARREAARARLRARMEAARAAQATGAADAARKGGPRPGNTASQSGEQKRPK